MKSLFDRLLDYYHVSMDEYRLLTMDVSKENFDAGHEFLDMANCVRVVKEAVEGHKKIFIYGDYDCDGIMSVSILVKMFKMINYPVSYHIPNRYTDGYGLTLTRSEEIVKNGFDLLITVDNGITAFEGIEYAKEHKWWIRSDNSLLHTGDWQYWLTPDDGYESPVSPNIILDIKHSYDQFPYVDSFRYYDGQHTLSTHEGDYCLDSTDGSWYERTVYECSRCGHTVYGYEGDDMPDDMHYSDYDDCYYCDDCCWWCDAVDSYISVDDSPTDVYEFGDLTTYPQSYISDNLILDPNGTESGSDIVKVDGNYFIVAHSSDKIIWNKEKSEYEIIS